ncbi:MAG: hypothetical protein EHM61_03175 [Acidobacteria bacterium]|nr:MAG: hypothetical protein EHM61_03175 [Acidobacteriota bacterium]
MIYGLFGISLGSMFTAYALIVVGNALLLLILVRGLMAHLFHRYPAFYLYIGFILATGPAQIGIIAMCGLRSPAYYWAWNLPNLISPLFILLVLRDICKQVDAVGESRKKGSIVPFLVAGGAAVGLVASQLLITVGDPFFRFDAGALFAETLASIYVYTRVSGRRDVSLGRNLKGMLMGVSLLVGLQGVNFARLLFVRSPFEIFAFFLQFVYFLALSVFAYSLWSYEPAVELSADYRERIGKVGEDLEKAIRILVSPR